MKIIMITISVAAALVLSVFASTASATTLELNGVAQSSSIVLTASLKAGSSTLFTDTAQSQPPLNTCSVSVLQASTQVATGTAVTAGMKVPTFETCTQGNAVADTLGTLSIERITGTTNGTVRSFGTKMTWPSSVGTLTCLTSSTTGTDIGNITGVASGNATLDINAVLNCGVVTARWTGTYTVTSPTGLGVTS